MKTKVEHKKDTSERIFLKHINQMSLMEEMIRGFLKKLIEFLV